MRRLSSWFSCVRLTMVSRSDSFSISSSRMRDLTLTTSTCMAATAAARSATDIVVLAASAPVLGTARVYTSATMMLKPRVPPSAERRQIGRSVHAPPGRLRCYGHALEDDLEDGVAGDDVLVANAGRFRQLELASIEFLVDDDRARAVPRQDLHRVASFADEHEQRPRAGLRLHSLADDAAEALIAKPHVDGLERHVHRQPVRDHVSPPFSATITSRSNAASKPASRRMTTPSTSMLSDTSGVWGVGMTRANFGDSALRDRF